MASHSNHQSHQSAQRSTDNIYHSVDYLWFTTQFENLMERLASLEHTVTTIIQDSSAAQAEKECPATPREYYSVAEFASLVDRNEYTVREWCRLERINAEKCESGRGDAKNWKIPAAELQRYRDHGLQPLTYQ